MAGIRRPPRVPSDVKPKPPIPLHRRILGRGACELDIVADLKLELEKAYELDQIEYDTYLECHEALDVREAKALIELEKATGRYVKPEKNIPIKVKPVNRKKHKTWHIKLLFVFCFLIVWKLISFKP